MLAIIILFGILAVAIGAVTIGFVGHLAKFPSLLTAVLGGVWGYCVAQVCIVTYKSLL